MAYSKSERGFTLLEALIAASILAVVIMGAMAALGASTRGAAALVEANELEERRSVILDVLQQDVDRAGHNLLSATTYGTGTEQGLFFPHSEYSATSDGTFGTLTKTGPTGWTSSARVTRLITSGNGSVSCTLTFNSWVLLLNHNNPIAYRMIQVDSGTPAQTSISEDGQFVTTVPGHNSGDSYRIAQESTATGTVSVKYYRTRGGAETLLYTSARPPLPLPLSPLLAINTNGTSVTKIQVSGSVLADALPTLAPPPLPFDNATGQRLAEAITISTSGGALSQAVMIAGDESIDPVYTTAIINTTTTPLSLQVTAPRRGTFAAGDYVLLIDPRPASPASSLYRVTTVSTTTVLATLTLDAMTGAGPTTRAWNRLYSASSDRARTYTAGSQLVRLKPLVTYSVQQGRLVRSEAYRNGANEGERAATLAPGVTLFSMLATTSGMARAYTIALKARTEGFDTTATESQFNFTITPRAVTRPAEWTGQVP